MIRSTGAALHREWGVIMPRTTRRNTRWMRTTCRACAMDASQRRFRHGVDRLVMLLTDKHSIARCSYSGKCAVGVRSAELQLSPLKSAGLQREKQRMGRRPSLLFFCSHSGSASDGTAGRGSTLQSRVGCDGRNGGYADGQGMQTMALISLEDELNGEYHTARWHGGERSRLAEVYGRMAQAERKHAATWVEPPESGMTSQCLLSSRIGARSFWLGARSASCCAVLPTIAGLEQKDTQVYRACRCRRHGGR